MNCLKDIRIKIYSYLLLANIGKKIYYFKFSDLNRKNDDIKLIFTENSYQSIYRIGYPNQVSLSIVKTLRITKRRSIYGMEKK